MLDSYWAEWLVAGGKVPLAVVDFLDTSFVQPKDFPLLRAATCYFKINLYFWARRSIMPLESIFGMRRVITHTPKLRPLTNGVPKSKIPDTVRPMAERDIDVFFSGRMAPGRSDDDPNRFGELAHNPVRRDVYERVEKLKAGGKYNVVCVGGFVSAADYKEYLQRAKLVVCTESYGCETWRHGEVGAAGAVPLCNWPYTTNYMPYEPDVHAVYFSLIGEDFERAVDRVLADPAKLDAMARNVRAHTLQYKDRVHVGEMIVDETLRTWKR